MCYKDRTFCGFSETCNDGKSCGRALTKAIKDRANELFMPISQFIDKPNCYNNIDVCYYCEHLNGFYGMYDCKLYECNLCKEGCEPLCTKECIKNNSYLKIIIDEKLCSSCGIYQASAPSKLCCGCNEYKNHHGE